MARVTLYLRWFAALGAILVPFPLRSAKTADGLTPVLVELFTSEGCSSCPPADRLLQKIEGQSTPGARVIVLSEHVDYWDYLGWKDPFSSSQFSNRQRDYGQSFSNNGVYTPQMVINGRVEFVGNDGNIAAREIRKAATRNLAIVRVGPVAIEKNERGKSVATVQLAVGQLPQMSSGDELEMMLAVTESGLRSKPRTGENAGAALEHTGVVRTLVRAGRVEGQGFAAKAKFNVDPAWNREAVRVVAFVQEKKSRTVWGAAEAPLMESAVH